MSIDDVLEPLKKALSFAGLITLFVLLVTLLIGIFKLSDLERYQEAGFAVIGCFVISITFIISSYIDRENIHNFIRP